MKAFLARLLWNLTLYTNWDFTTSSFSKYSQHALTGTDGQKILDFYDTWQPYMPFHYGIWSAIVGTIDNIVVHGLYNLCRIIENIYDAMFSLLGWSSGMIASGGALANVYMGMEVIGSALMILGLIILAYENFVHEISWGKPIRTMIMVTAVFCALPLLMQQLDKAEISVVKDINNVEIEGTENSAGSLSRAPVRNNTIDLVYVAWQGWTGDPTEMPSSSNKLNNLTSNARIKHMDFTDYLNKTTSKIFFPTAIDKTGDKIAQATDAAISSSPGGKGFIGKALQWVNDKAIESATTTANNFMNMISGGDSSKYWIAEPFKYHVYYNQGVNGVNMLRKLTWSAAAGSLNDQVYSRYYVYWLPLIGQYAVIIFVLFMASLRIIKDIFQLLIMQVVAPIIAFRSLGSGGKQMRELLSSIVGTFISIAFLILTIRIWFMFVVLTPDALDSASLSGITKNVATVMVYIGTAFALFSGLTIIERMTGVSQSLQNEKGTAMALAGLGFGAASAAGNFATGGVGGMVKSMQNNRSRGVSSNLGGNTSNLSMNNPNLHHDAGFNNVNSNSNNLDGGLGGAGPMGQAGAGGQGTNGPAGPMGSGANGQPGGNGQNGLGANGQSGSQGQAGMGANGMNGDNGNGMDGQTGFAGADGDGLNGTHGNINVPTEDQQPSQANNPFTGDQTSNPDSGNQNPFTQPQMDNPTSESPIPDAPETNNSGQSSSFADHALNGAEKVNNGAAHISDGLGSVGNHLMQNNQFTDDESAHYDGHGNDLD